MQYPRRRWQTHRGNFATGLPAHWQSGRMYEPVMTTVSMFGCSTEAARYRARTVELPITAAAIAARTGHLVLHSRRYSKNPGSDTGSREPGTPRFNYCRHIKNPAPVN